MMMARMRGNSACIFFLGVAILRVYPTEPVPGGTTPSTAVKQARSIRKTKLACFRVRRTCHEKDTTGSDLLYAVLPLHRTSWTFTPDIVIVHNPPERFRQGELAWQIKEGP